MAACDSCGKNPESCGGCESGCPGANGGAQSFSQMKKEPGPFSVIHKVIGVCSGKGGVGKSFVTSVLAAKLARKGLRVGIMDADITGPSIPMAFGLKETLKGSQMGILPAMTESGIQIVSINLLTDDVESPVIWRGPVLSQMVGQFWTDVVWENLDVLLIDMPPGTGDVPLTVFQTIPLDGIIIVSTPQDLVSMVVSKAKNMAKMMDVNILGFVENMSYIKCPHCDDKITLFGEGGVEKAANDMDVPLIEKLPLDSAQTALIDRGEIEKIDSPILDDAVIFVEDLLKESHV